LISKSGIEREYELHEYELKIRSELIEIAESKEIARRRGGENWSCAKLERNNE